MKRDHICEHDDPSWCDKSCYIDNTTVDRERTRRILRVPLTNPEDGINLQDYMPELYEVGNGVQLSGKKHDKDKIRVELLPPGPLIEIAKVLTFGAIKYESWNWTKGFKWSRLIGALLRHTYAWMRGEDKDPETGLSHLAHVGCCVLFLLEHEQKGLGEDDRYKGGK